LSLARTAIVAALSGASALACHDVSDFSTVNGGVYEGSITGASFVRTGIGETVKMCLTIDANNLQSASPGSVSTSDGLFHSTRLRSIPQVWSDPLSTLSFGEGRIQNVLYVAYGNAGDGGAREGGVAEATASGDVFVVVSFMVSGSVEVRLLRGAPDAPEAGVGVAPPQVFGVFTLSRKSGTCSF
jgi:hypothetical protein